MIGTLITLILNRIQCFAKAVVVIDNPFNNNLDFYVVICYIYITMPNKTYTRLLADKQWKDKRVGILKRDNNKCRECGREQRLQVHHLYYDTAKMPWDYPAEALITLCFQCHDAKHKDVQDYIKVYPLFFEIMLPVLSSDNGLSRLILYIMKKVLDLSNNSKNIIIADNDEFMKSLNISKPTLIRYIADLCALNIIERLKPRMPIYRINPNMIYKGTLTKYYKKYIEEHIKE